MCHTFVWRQRTTIYLFSILEGVNKYMKNFIQNSFLFCTIGIFVVFIPLIYIKYSMQIASFPELQTLKKALKSNKDVILFGSSVNRHTSSNDTDKRSIAEMLDKLLTKQNVVGISHGAYQADIYLEFVKYIAKQKRDEKPIIIIPINLRYFSPEWDLRPSYQFAKEKCLLNGYPFWANFKYREIKETEFHNFLVYNPNGRIEKVKDYLYISTKELDKLSEMRKGFIFRYMQPLKANHRKLKSLLKICEIGKETDLKIVMYITPIDYTYAEQLKIQGFRQHLYDSVNTIKSTLASCEIELIDLSMVLNSSYFDYNQRPNEHLNMSGRREVAKALKSAIYHIVNP